SATDSPPPSLYPLSLHDALPISSVTTGGRPGLRLRQKWRRRNSQPGRGSGETASLAGKRITKGRSPFSPGKSMTCSAAGFRYGRSEEHTSELQSRENLVCRLLLE